MSEKKIEEKYFKRKSISCKRYIKIIMIMTIEKNIALTTILRGDKGVAAASTLKKFRMNAKNANAS